MYALYMSGVRLPVAPSQIEYKINNQNKTVDLLGIGEVNRIKSPGLTQITFEVLIPHKQYPFAIYPDGFKNQEYYLKLFSILKNDKRPFEFLVVRDKDKSKEIRDLPIMVSLESYTIIEDASNAFDLLIKIELKEYKAYNTGFVVDSRNEHFQENHKSYTVQDGDTLWGICKKFLGDGTAYVKIAKINKIPNPNLIYPGQVIIFE